MSKVNVRSRSTPWGTCTTCYMRTISKYKLALWGHWRSQSKNSLVSCFIGSHWFILENLFSVNLDFDSKWFCFLLTQCLQSLVLRKHLGLCVWGAGFIAFKMYLQWIPATFTPTWQKQEIVQIYSAPYSAVQVLNSWKKKKKSFVNMAMYN